MFKDFIRKHLSKLKQSVALYRANRMLGKLEPQQNLYVCGNALKLWLMVISYASEEKQEVKNHIERLKEAYLSEFSTVNGDTPNLPFNQAFWIDRLKRSDPLKEVRPIKLIKKVSAYLSIEETSAVLVKLFCKSLERLNLKEYYRNFTFLFEEENFSMSEEMFKKFLHYALSRKKQQKQQ